MQSGNTANGCINHTISGGTSPCNLSVPAFERLNQFKSTTRYPKHAKLFIEGQKPEGLFVICAGQVKLSTCSCSGRTIITRIARRGDILGLTAVVCNRPYEGTAEVMETGLTCFIPRDRLLQLMKDDKEAVIQITEQLSRDYYTAHESARNLALATEVKERLAKFLLSWSDNQRVDEAGSHTSIEFKLTHDEIAETIGSTRETVTRLLSEFREKEMVQMQKSSFSICDRMALEGIVHF